MKLSHTVRFTILLTIGLHGQAQAGWLDNEWRNFRTYPRLQKAYKAFKNKDFPTVLKMLNEVETIDPDQRDAIILHAQTCGLLKDYDCLKKLGESWQARFPTDALGYYITGNLGVVTQNDDLIIDNFRSAVENKGMNDEHRVIAATNWVDALIRQKRITEARAVIDWLKLKKVPIAAAAVARWDQQFTQQKKTDALAAAELIKQQTLTSERIATAIPNVPPKNVMSTAQPSKLITSTINAAPHFPYAEVEPVLRETMLKDGIYQQVTRGEFTQLKRHLAILRKENLYTPAIEEALAINLQTSNCDLLLDEILVNINPQKTTETSQLAAAFCAEKQTEPLWERAAHHFGAASQLRIQAGLSPLPSTLNDEGDDWFQLHHFEEAMRCWDASLSLHANLPLSHRLAEVALHNFDLPISQKMLDKYAQFLGAGEFDYARAKNAQHNEDLAAAAQFYRASLAVNSTAIVWHELAYVYSKMGNLAGQSEALVQALKLDETNANMHAEYAFLLKNSQPSQTALALSHFKSAYKADPSRSDYLVEIANLELASGNTDAAVIYFRESINHQKEIQQIYKTTDDVAAQQLFDWQRLVQHFEDRWSFSIGVQNRLNNAPKINENALISPEQFAQYGSVIDAEVDYRLDPLWFSDNPGWIFARASHGLEDQSFALINGNGFSSLGFKQRLMSDQNVIGSIEWINRNDLPISGDVMARLSASHSYGIDWKPSVGEWSTLNIYGDIARLIRNRTYYATLSGQFGQQRKVNLFDSKSTLKPYIGFNAAANDDNFSQKAITRLDVVAGVNLQTWFGGDAWRAPGYRQQISLELHRQLAGNSNDHTIVLLQWRYFH